MSKWQQAMTMRNRFPGGTTLASSEALSNNTVTGCSHKGRPTQASDSSVGDIEGIIGRRNHLVMSDVKS